MSADTREIPDEFRGWQRPAHIEDRACSLAFRALHRLSLHAWSAPEVPPQNRSKAPSRGLQETLEPLDARQDKDMYGNCHFTFSHECPVPIKSAFPESAKFLILNSRKQHRVGTAPVN